MRTTAVALISALFLATPAMAQQNGSGIDNVLRNLGNALNHNENQNQGNYGQQYNNNNRGYSGSSTYEPTYNGNQMVLRNQSDVENEQQRLNWLQGQLNHAQQELNRESRDFNQAQSRTRGGSNNQGNYQQ